MISVIISGCNGKMGQVLSKMIEESSDFQVFAGITRTPHTKQNRYLVYTSFYQQKSKADVIIDFSHPLQLKELLNYAVETSTPAVISTTGLSSEIKNDMITASKTIPIFYSANMSLGINLLIDLVKKSSGFLKYDFDIEIVEKHHNKKIDAPSGTAFMIAEAINDVLGNKEMIFSRHEKRESRKNNEIGIYAIRGGTIVGEHEVIFAGKDEIIEIKHRALSKEIFALGALRAAKFLIKQTHGYYEMNDLLRE